MACPFGLSDHRDMHKESDERDCLRHYQEVHMPASSPLHHDVQTLHDGVAGDQVAVGQGTRVLDYSALYCDLEKFAPSRADATFALGLGPPCRTCACVVSALPSRANPVWAIVHRPVPTGFVSLDLSTLDHPLALCLSIINGVFWLPHPPLLSCCTVLQVPIAAVEWMAEEMPACTLSVKMGG